jgi:hypothetical protein
VSSLARKQSRLTPNLKGIDINMSNVAKNGTKKKQNEKLKYNLIFRCFFFDYSQNAILTQLISRMLVEEKAKNEYIILNKNVKLKHKHDIYE